MRLADWHTYQVLTKRSERLRELLAGPLRKPQMMLISGGASRWKTVKYGLPRIADLQAAPAAVRFLSVEPLLEDIGESAAGRHLLGDCRRAKADPARGR